MGQPRRPRAPDADGNVHLQLPAALFNRLEKRAAETERSITGCIRHLLLLALDMEDDD